MSLEKEEQLETCIMCGKQGSRKYFNENLCSECKQKYLETINYENGYGGINNSKVLKPSVILKRLKELEEKYEELKKQYYEDLNKKGHIIVSDIRIADKDDISNEASSVPKFNGIVSPMRYSKESVNKFILENKIDIEDLKNKAVEYIRENAKNDEKFVVGISGGKDSTVVFQLLVEAVGRDRVYPVLIPFINRGSLAESYIEKFEFNENLEEVNTWGKKFNYRFYKNDNDPYYYAQNTITGIVSIIGKKGTLFISPDDKNIRFFDYELDIEPAHIEPLVYGENNDFYTKFIGSQNLLRIPIESDLKDCILHYHNMYYFGNTTFYKDQLFKDNNDFLNALDKNMKELFESNEKNACYFSMKENSDRNFVVRMRMNILYYIANSIPHGRVVNTSNYSEKILGWTTKWGDNVGDLFPLRYLTAHEVGALGLALGVPEEYLFISPSDDMLGKTDEDALGISYYELDSAIMKKCNKDFGRTIDVLRSQQSYLLKELKLDERIDIASHKLYIV